MICWICFFRSYDLGARMIHCIQQEKIQAGDVISIDKVKLLFYMEQLNCYAGIGHYQETWSLVRTCTWLRCAGRECENRQMS